MRWDWSITPRGRALGAVVAGVLILGGCASDVGGSPEMNRSGPSYSALDSVMWSRPFHEDFLHGYNSLDWQLADFEPQAGIHNVIWSGRSVRFRDGMAELVIEAPRWGSGGRHHSGQMHRRSQVGHGRFEVVLRPAGGSGLITNFHTYTGSAFGTPHEEIGFAFLGRDTEAVLLQFTGADGQTYRHRHRLGFDAAEGFHTYAFEWSQDSLKWFVDGTIVHERPNDAPPVPVHPARIFASLWTGTEETYSWLGRPNFYSGTPASFECISYRPLDGDGRMCSDVSVGSR